MRIRFGRMFYVVEIPKVPGYDVLRPNCQERYLNTDIHRHSMIRDNRDIMLPHRANMFSSREHRPWSEIPSAKELNNFASSNGNADTNI